MIPEGNPIASDNFSAEEVLRTACNYHKVFGGGDRSERASEKGSAGVVFCFWRFSASLCWVEQAYSPSLPHPNCRQNMFSFFGRPGLLRGTA